MLSTASRPRDLATGLLLSLGVHALLIGGLAGAGVTAGAFGPDAALTTLLPEEIPPEAESEVPLGNGESDVETNNWLGVDALNEQQAPKAEVEQPELSIDPGSGAAAPPAVPQPAPIPEAAVIPPQSAPAAAPGASPHTAAEAQAPDVAPQLVPGDVPLASVATPSPAPVAATPVTAKPTVPPGGSPSQPGDGRGIKSTSESAAAALKDAVTVIPGRVASAKGLRISTKRPEWSATTRAIRNPGNAVMQITFARDGTARHVAFLSDGRREYRTGFPDVDEPLVTALYQWTAQGDALLRLPEDDPKAGVTITFKILLTRG